MCLALLKTLILVVDGAHGHEREFGKSLILRLSQEYFEGARLFWFGQKCGKTNAGRHLFALAVEEMY